VIAKSGLVSIVVASYRHVQFLRQRMDSLLNQTYRNLEIIVIDDCSPENNLEVLQEYRQNPRVKVIPRAENGGWVVVSNMGIELSKGEYLLFANCDDACEPTLVEDLVRGLQMAPTAGVAFCRSLLVDKDNKVLGDDYEIRERAFREYCASNVLVPGSQMRQFLFHSCVIPNLSGAIFRRTCFEYAGPFSSDYKACGDWILFFKLCERFDFWYHATPLNHFRQHDRTIRAETAGKTTYEEFFRVLLGELRRGGLTTMQRARIRLHVMYLWSVDLIRPGRVGWSYFPHHLGLVASLDPWSLLFLIPAMFRRLIELPGKVVRHLFRFRPAS
jgi:glycosyltransferase involved in cell wall biosynthesis